MILRRALCRGFSLFIMALSLPLANSFLQGRSPAAQESMSFSVAGKITQHTGNKLTLNTEGNIIFRVVYSDKTTVTRQDGSAGSPKDLAVGTRIHVDGDLQESGEITAGKIRIQADATGKSS